MRPASPAESPVFPEESRDAIGSEQQRCAAGEQDQTRSGRVMTPPPADPGPPPVATAPAGTPGRIAGSESRTQGLRPAPGADHRAGRGRRRCRGRGAAGDPGHHRPGVHGAGAHHHREPDPVLADPPRGVPRTRLARGVPDRVRDRRRPVRRRDHRGRATGHPDAAVRRPDPTTTGQPVDQAGRTGHQRGRPAVDLQQHRTQPTGRRRAGPARPGSPGSSVSCCS